MQQEIASRQECLAARLGLPKEEFDFNVSCTEEQQREAVIRSRVVSMPSWGILDRQTGEYRAVREPPPVDARIAVEQASTSPAATNRSNSLIPSNVIDHLIILMAFPHQVLIDVGSIIWEEFRASQGISVKVDNAEINGYFFFGPRKSLISANGRSNSKSLSTMI